MKKEEISKYESLIDTRDKLVELREELKRNLYNILRRYGIETEKEFLFSKKGLEKALSYEIGDTAKVELKVCIDQIKSLTESIEKIERFLLINTKDERL